MKKLEPPKKLTAKDYEWYPTNGDDDFGPPPTQWFTWSRAYQDDGCSMEYKLRRTNKGRYTLWFEGSQFGPKEGYTTKGRAAGVIAKNENIVRMEVYNERKAKREKRKARNA